MLSDSHVPQRELRDPPAAPSVIGGPLVETEMWSAPTPEAQANSAPRPEAQANSTPWPEAQANSAPPTPSVTVIVPAFNEESGIRDTLDALMRQTLPPAKIIVVDDCSTDRTSEVARSYGVSVLRTPANLGSKARAQNYALPHCDTELVLPVDADTVLADNYVERIVRPFADPDVVVAAGAVQTKITRTVTERGRSIEYLFGFHYYRPIQQLANSVVVCSGCCSAFRRENLVAFGGFPERTIVEDMDFTWSQQILGRKAVYVSGAVAWAADPASVKFLRKQVRRWMSGFFQNVRIHWRDLVKHKRMLGIWVALALAEICMAPIWWVSPVLLPLVFHMSFIGVMSWWFGLETAMLLPPLLYACVRRRLNPARVLINIPCVYFNKAFNTYYAWKALIVELILVPLGRSSGLVIYEKGR